MQRVTIDAVEGREHGADSLARRLTENLGAEHVAVNHYRLSPGDGFPGGLHAHTDQEELFVVLDGEATFETCASPLTESGQRREVVVETGEVVRFEAGEFQSGRNAGDDELVALALGAPRDSEDVRVPFACPDCGDATLALDFAGAFVFACPACGSERSPAPCPNCEHDDLRATLDGDGNVVAACEACGEAHDRPPVEGEWD